MAAPTQQQQQPPPPQQQQTNPAVGDNLLASFWASANLKQREYQQQDGPVVGTSELRRLGLLTSARLAQQDDQQEAGPATGAVDDRRVRLRALFDETLDIILI